MRDKRIILTKLAAERDHAISPGAFRLLCRIGSMIYVNPRIKLEDAFPLPWSKVAEWLDLDDDKAASRKIAELVDAQYLRGDGLRGCPPINHFFLVPNCPEKGAIDCPARGAIKRPQRGAIDCPARGAHHISNSFQEEKIKGKREEIKSSLRSKGTNGEKLAATRKMTEAERLERVQALSQLRRDLASKTGTGSF